MAAQGELVDTTDEEEEEEKEATTRLAKKGRTATGATNKVARKLYQEEDSDTMDDEEEEEDQEYEEDTKKRATKKRKARDKGRKQAEAEKKKKKDPKPKKKKKKKKKKGEAKPDFWTDEMIKTFRKDPNKLNEAIQERKDRVRRKGGRGWTDCIKKIYGEKVWKAVTKDAYSTKQAGDGLVVFGLQNFKDVRGQQFHGVRNHSLRKLLTVQFPQHAKAIQDAHPFGKEGGGKVNLSDATIDGILARIKSNDEDSSDEDSSDEDSGDSGKKQNGKPSARGGNDSSDSDSSSDGSDDAERAKDDNIGGKKRAHSQREGAKSDSGESAARGGNDSSDNDSRNDDSDERAKDDNDANKITKGKNNRTGTTTNDNTNKSESKARTPTTDEAGGKKKKKNDDAGKRSTQRNNNNKSKKKEGGSDRDGKDRPAKNPTTSSNKSTNRTNATTTKNKRSGGSDQAKERATKTPDDDAARTNNHSTGKKRKRSHSSRRRRSSSSRRAFDSDSDGESVVGVYMTPHSSSNNGGDKGKRTRNETKHGAASETRPKQGGDSPSDQDRKDTGTSPTHSKNSEHDSEPFDDFVPLDNGDNGVQSPRFRDDVSDPLPDNNDNGGDAAVGKQVPKTGVSDPALNNGQPEGDRARRNNNDENGDDRKRNNSEENEEDAAVGAAGQTPPASKDAIISKLSLLFTTDHWIADLQKKDCTPSPDFCDRFDRWTSEHQESTRGGGNEEQVRKLFWNMMEEAQLTTGQFFERHCHWGHPSHWDVIHSYSLERLRRDYPDTNKRVFYLPPYGGDGLASLEIVCQQYFPELDSDLVQNLGISLLAYFSVFVNKNSITLNGFIEHKLKDPFESLQQVWESLRTFWATETENYRIAQQSTTMDATAYLGVYDIPGFISLSGRPLPGNVSFTIKPTNFLIDELRQKRAAKIDSRFQTRFETWRTQAEASGSGADVDFFENKHIFYHMMKDLGDECDAFFDRIDGQTYWEVVRFYCLHRMQQGGFTERELSDDIQKIPHVPPSGPIQKILYVPPSGPTDPLQALCAKCKLASNTTIISEESKECLGSMMWCAYWIMGIDEEDCSVMSFAKTVMSSNVKTFLALQDFLQTRLRWNL